MDVKRLNRLFPHLCHGIRGNVTFHFRRRIYQSCDEVKVRPGFSSVPLADSESLFRLLFPTNVCRERSRLIPDTKHIAVNQEVKRRTRPSGHIIRYSSHFVLDPNIKTFDKKPDLCNEVFHY